MKVTDEMIAVARDASIKLNGHCSTYLETKASLQAVLDLINPVPDEVNEILDKDGDRWVRAGTRSTKLTWGLDKSSHDDIRLSIDEIVNRFGPITWEGKDA